MPGQILTRPDAMILHEYLNLIEASSPPADMAAAEKTARASMALIVRMALALFMPWDSIMRMNPEGLVCMHPKLFTGIYTHCGLCDFSLAEGYNVAINYLKYNVKFFEIVGEKS